MKKYKKHAAGMHKTRGTGTLLPREGYDMPHRGGGARVTPYKIPRAKRGQGRTSHTGLRPGELGD